MGINLLLPWIAGVLAGLCCGIIMAQHAMEGQAIQHGYGTYDERHIFHWRKP